MEMLGFIKKLLVVISTLLPVFEIHASDPCLTDTWGQEFYVAAIQPSTYINGRFNPSSVSGSVQYSLHSQSKRSGRITISAPGAKYNRVSYVRKGATSFDLPTSLHISAPDTVNKTGIKVTANVDITLTLFVHADSYYAAALVLPKSVLSTEYIVPSGKNDIIIISLQNSTRFDASNIYVSTNLLGENDVYYISSGHSASTTTITSNNPIAVYAASITGNAGCFFEQMIPPTSWGYRYIVPNIYDDRHYAFQVTASQADTYINTYYQSHPGTIYLQRARAVGATFDAGPYVLTSSKPIVVTQVGTEGHFMVNVPAISHFSDSYYISIPSSHLNNFIVIITTEHDEGGITFDSTYIPTRRKTSSVMLENVKYTVIIYSVMAGELRIFHNSPGGKFGGYVYGYSYISSHLNAYYAFPLGLTLKEEGCIPPPTTTVTVPASVTTAVPALPTNETICFACQDMSSLVFCDHVQTCEHGKECYVEKHLTSGGETKYSSGCTYTNMCHQSTRRDSSCHRCCTGSYCNNVGCGDTSTPARSQRGPFCYDCGHIGKVEECHRISLCRSDQVCSIRRYSWGDTLSHYTLGCEDKGCLAPSQSVPLGRKRSTPNCERCCQDDFCNKYCTQTKGHTGLIIG